MNYKLKEALNIKMEPVAICFTDEKPDDAVQFEEGKRGCVASVLISTAKTLKTAVFDRNTYGCAGGGVGICFGDMFTADNHPTEKLLSNGFGFGEDSKDMPDFLKYGERFFASPELVGKWKKAMPYQDTDKEYVVFKPLSDVADDETPDLVLMFVDPDQLSALVIMSGYFRGTPINTIAPYGAACHNILYAYNEIGKDEPMAVMGFFDLAQRWQIPKDILSFTVTFSMYEEIERAIPEGCLTTESWKKIAGR